MLPLTIALVRGVATVGGLPAAGPFLLVKDKGGTFATGLTTGGFTNGAVDVAVVASGSVVIAAAKAFSAFDFRLRLSFTAGGPFTSGTGNAEMGPAGGVFFGFAPVLPRFCSALSNCLCSRARVLACSSSPTK